MIKSPLPTGEIIQSALNRNYKTMAETLETVDRYPYSIDEQKAMTEIHQAQKHIKNIRKFANEYWNEKKST